MAGPIGHLPDYGLPIGRISEQSIRAAGMVMLAYQYGIRLRMFDAVGKAFALLDTDRLCLDVADPAERALVDRLACWPERDLRIDGDRMAQLQAKILGIPHPDVPDAERDTRIQLLLGSMLDGVAAVCDPGPCRNDPTDHDIALLETRTRAVRARLSSTMTGLAAYRTRELQVQLDSAQTILTDLAGHLQLACRPRGVAPVAAGMWEALDALVGDDLDADGIDILDGAETAQAWFEVFTWLDGYPGGRPPGVVCRSASILRPRPCTWPSPCRPADVARSS